MKPSEDGLGAPSTALAGAAPALTASSEKEEVEDDDNEVAGEEIVDEEGSSLTTKKFRNNFNEWSEEVMKSLLEVRGTIPSSCKCLKTEL